jgi:hypothetical protein
MHLRGAVSPLLLAGACLIAAAGTAAAADVPPKSPHDAAIASPAVPSGRALHSGALAAGARSPKGYEIVRSGSFDAPPGEQVRGSADCLFPLVPLGGGVLVQSSSTLVNVNTTHPTSTGWVVDVNNGSDADTTFVVSVICAREPKLYTVVASLAVDDPPGGQAQASVACPRGTRPFSGGVLSSSESVLVNINSTIVDAHGWTARESNASAAGAEINAFVVCGKLGGYATVIGPNGFMAAQSQTPTFVDCPAGSVAIGGGTTTSSTSIDVNVNSSTVGIGEWDSFENNATDVNEQFLVRTEIECAGVVG